jgi:hypothetical protein
MRQTLRRLRPKLRRLIARSWIPLTLLLSAVRPSPPRSGERRDLVFRLRRQHARQRLSGPTRHPAARALFGPHQGLSTALQSGRPAQGQGCTSEPVSRSEGKGMGRALSHHEARPIALGLDGRSTRAGVSRSDRHRPETAEFDELWHARSLRVQAVWCEPDFRGRVPSPSASDRVCGSTQIPTVIGHPVSGRLN